MAQICLLDSDRLTGLLRAALSWTDSVSSLIVSAKNGSILAYAFKNNPPSIRDMRTKSTTFTAAYTAASENSLVLESQTEGEHTVITPIAEYVLLAVTGITPTQSHRPNTQDNKVQAQSSEDNGQDEELHDNGEERRYADTEKDHDEQLRIDLEMVSQELATMLREELNGMKWPDDI